MSETTESVAVIGMAGRFPGARSVPEFWANLCAGRETISRFTPEQLEPGSREDMASRADPHYVPARGILHDVDRFDAAFFGINPKEAEVLDPQQRIFLETVWEALEDAGCDPQKAGGPVGLYAGASNNTYYLQHLFRRPDVIDIVGGRTTMRGNEKDFLATRAAYKLDLRGPALNIQTACSTSLVAVCTAVQSLLSYQCDLALAGGVSITLPQRSGYLWQEGMILSPDGHCRAFDVRAQGTVFSNGVGVVVLKRLSEALAAGDRIDAVIRGSALNNDGSSKVSFAAPSVDGQAEVIALAQAIAAVEPETVTYVEAHGTGTALGDPIELAGLTQAFRSGGARRSGYCAIGSVKTNIGHLDAAAGVAGLIKTVLALKHRRIPPSLHYEQPNPRLEIEASPFFVNTRLTAWEKNGTPRRAGVSSFGVGGTNAHVVLEEAPPARAGGGGRSRHLLVLSARSREQVDVAGQRLERHLADADVDMADVAYTLQTGRRAFSHRRVLVCRDRADALRVLQNADPKRAFDASAETPISGVAFLFPGQGAQQVNMGRTLYREERRFREEVDECSAVLAPHIGSDLRRILYPETGGTSAAEAQLTQTAVTQPALFVVEYALARLWASWGIEPAAMIGHSLGEYVAACLAGVFRRDDALLLLARRARMMQALPSGAMLAVRSSAEAIRDELTSGTALAALNAPNMTVVAGEHEAIAALEARLAAREIECRRLATSHAFHSPMMEPITREFAEFVASVPRGPPAQRWISSLTGEPITDAQAIDPDYWARQMRHPVRYMDGIGKLLRPELALLEVGPGQALVSLARQHPDRTPAQLMIASLHGGRDGEGDLDALLMAAGRLWSAGLSIDWSALHAGSQRSRVSLPAYPFERTRYWVEPSADSARQDPQPATANPSAVPDTFMPDTISNAPAPQSGSAAALLPRLQKLFSELSGIAATALEPGTSFLDLGLDSLFLTQVSNALNKQFGAQVSMRALLDEYSTLDALAGHLAPLVTPEPAPARPPAAAVSPSGSASRTPAAAPEPAALPGTLQEVLAQQLELMSRQLEVLRNAAALGSASSPAPPVQQPVPEQPAPEQPAAAAEHRAPVAFGPYRPPSRTPASRLSAEQDRHLRTFIDRYAERTAGSKRYTAEHRAHLADPRTVAGFRPLWKEIVYPIVVNRSAGARLWDVDGNEYIDLTNGFGTILFGHNPEFVRGAIEAQLRQGIETGPQTPLAGEVAHLICEMTGMARAAFCSTGSEAVTAAIRVARTISGRDRIVLFSGAYHGISDEVLVRPTLAGGARRAMPIAPGIPVSMSDNVVVLEYGTPESLEAIRSMGRELAAVLVEPVQSRRPEFQPRDFLRELRKITADAETALVFDEVVTGFRSHPGGAQALFGVRADIATYGKVIGGGLPIGVVAGCPRYLDALDGGDWRYGDDSSPEVGVTFFAGTFVRHPIALCVARAVLSRLKQEGPELQRALNLRTTRFVETLNRHAEATGAPVRIAHFASWFCVNLPHELPFASLFFAHMRAKGVHIWEGRPAFLTLAHSDEVLARVTDAFRETLRQMQAAGFLAGGQDAPPVRGARKGRDASGRPAWFIPDPDRTGKYLQIQETAEAQ